MEQHVTLTAVRLDASLKLVFVSTPDITFMIRCRNPFSHDKLLVIANVSHTLIISCLNLGPSGYECQVHCDTKQWRCSEEKKKKQGKQGSGWTQRAAVEAKHRLSWRRSYKIHWIRFQVLYFCLYFSLQDKQHHKIIYLK